MSLEDIVSSIHRKIKPLFQEFEVIGEKSTEIMLKLANGEPTVVQSWSNYRLIIYVAKDKKIMHTAISSRDPQELINKIPKIMEKLNPSPLYAPLPEPSGKDYRFIDSKIQDVLTSGDLSELTEDLELNLADNWAGMIRLGLTQRHLVNSNGAELMGEKTFFDGYMRVFTSDDASGQWSWTSSNYRPDLAKKAINTAVKISEECGKLARIKIEPGEYRLLLSPMVVGNLLNNVVMAANGAGMLFGFSFFTKDDLNKRVASEKLSVMDKPLSRDLPGYSLFDDEGVKTYDKFIIRNGVLETILHNSKTAKMFGVETTGNAGLIFPRAFNIEVNSGDMNDYEMYEILHDGLYITNNWYTRFQNYVEGLFSTVARDAVIVVRKGKPIGCTTRIRIADTMKNILNNIEAVGKTLWQVQWWEIPVPSRLPHLLVSNAKITSE